MASSYLLACGRGAPFKIVKLQVWNLRSLPSTVSLCTNPGDSEKGSTKNKGENIISGIPEETVKLTDEGLKKFWANKTLVTFPQRAFPSLGREPGFPLTGDSNEKSDKESSLSSSSESDSSSDEEDNVIKDTLKTKVAFPSWVPISSEESPVKENTASEQQFPQSQKEGSTPEKHLNSPIISESLFKEKGAPFPRQAPIPSEDRAVKVPVNASKQQFPTPENHSAPRYSPRITEPLTKEKGMCQTTDKLLRSKSMKRTTKQTSAETHLKGTDLGINPTESQRPIANQLETSKHETAHSKWSKTQQQSMTAHSLTLLKQEESTARGVQDAESQGKGTLEVQEELLDDAVPVAEATMKEEITLETGIQDGEQSIAQEEVKEQVETAQEAIDISTYKNLQHHEYTPFTFVNYDVELSKFRLPQPSSGRH